MTRSLPRLALPHLSDEAVAAFADGVLRAAAQQRARQHIYECRDCADAVNGQRAASAVLRAAAAPTVPLGLMDRLRELPDTADLPVPTRSAAGLSPDGQPVFAAFGTRSGPGGSCATEASRPRGTDRVATATVTATAASLIPPPLMPPPLMSPPLMSPPLIPALGFVPPVPARTRAASPSGADRHRRLASPASGLAAAATAAVAVGLLASTAAAAGGAAASTVPTAPTQAVPATGAAPARFDQPAVLTHPVLQPTGPR